jgi:lipopolysaccharide/colanic/teichoic acid biosynthesis glycosyltransferase
MKRVFDFLIAILMLVISLPLWPFIALGIKLDSKGPVFYSQRRVGKRNKIFTLIKFRSMVERAENGVPLWAAENDDRITRMGRVLRSFHVDELPQLFHVIKGEMSLVGPRPERPEFVEVLRQKIPSFDERHKVKPGITGWAQVQYPYAASIADYAKKVEYDLYYIQNRSLLLDLKILLLTAKRLLGK